MQCTAMGGQVALVRLLAHVRQLTFPRKLQKAVTMTRPMQGCASAAEPNTFYKNRFPSKSLFEALQAAAAIILHTETKFVFV